MNIYAETMYMDLLCPSPTGRDAYMLATLVTAIDVALNVKA
jgi:hypothetical protein